MIFLVFEKLLLFDENDRLKKLFLEVFKFVAIYESRDYLDFE